MEASIVVGKLLEQKSSTFGFDAQNEKYVDLVDSGIVDPTKVVRTALQDASSVASLLITTEAMVADRPAKPAGGGGHAGHGHGGGGEPASTQSVVTMFIVGALAFWFVGANAPATFLNHFTVFVLACFIGYMVIWNVTPALHTPLMKIGRAHV